MLSNIILAIRLWITQLLLFTTLASACVGGLLGDSAFHALVDTGHATQWERARWQELPNHSSKITDLLGAGPATVYARDESGQLVQCEMASSFDQRCWVPLQTLPIIDPEVACPPNPQVVPDDQWLTDDVPIGISITDHVEMTYCVFGFAGEVSISDFRYILTPEGRVWQWVVDPVGVANTPRLDRIALGITSLGCLVGWWLPLGIISLLWVPEIFLYWRRRRMQKVAG